jgi:predicted transcriptional regulator
MTLADALLSRRERQILESLYRRGRATVAEILEDLPDAPTDSALRAMLRLLEGKKRVRRQFDGRRLVYEPTVSRERASAKALQNLMRTFFGGSHERTVRAILSEAEGKLSREELDRLAAMIEDARGRRRDG